MPAMTAVNACACVRHPRLRERARARSRRRLPGTQAQAFTTPLLALLAALALQAGPARAQQAGGIPSPEAYLGFRVGEDRKLADWTQITGYMEKLAASPRVRLDTLGKTTLGRPFIMLTITSPANMARLAEFKEIQRKLADPRLIASPEEAERLVARGRTVVLITGGIHSTEVGGFQSPMIFAHRLATSDAPEVREILDNTIVLLIPSLNPDGSQMVVDWYRKTLGKPWEGTQPPFLYHHYAGHDDNRDWYAFLLPETRLVVEKAYGEWHPQISHDIHQQGQRGSRFFLPPFMDPWEPNVDPILTEGVNQLGAYMAWRLGQEGKKGIVLNSTYDAWSPARAFQHYHGAVRILSETASADMATPVAIPFDSLTQGRGFDARVATWNFPDPWPGGEWHLSDIVAYQDAGAMALLEHAAKHREAWLRSFLRVGQRAVAKWDRWPAAWLIPAEQRDSAALQELLRILTTAQVEVRRAGKAFTAEGMSYPAGTYVVPMNQPYASFAQAVLERQDYPDLRLYPGGPPKPPYDVTAQTLPLLLGVEAIQAKTLPGPDALALSAPIPTPAVEHRAAGLTPGVGPRAPRIGIYASYAPSMDEGWTRLVLDEYRIPFTVLHDADIRAGKLRSRLDVVILPSQSSRAIHAGRRAGTIAPEYTGGLGEEGAKALRDFMQAGGTVVALEQATEYAIEHLGFPARNVTKGLPSKDFYIPGSILSLDLDGASPHAAGMPTRTIAWFGGESLAFEPTSSEVKVVGRYGKTETLLSGWALGREKVAGQAALAVAPVGKGKLVAFGFRPQYRGQSMATFPLLWNALRPAPGGATSTER
ncbi:MAG: peptidase M14 [Gemmatimonadetes bacterium]|nr:peptidase M14 [Gemmatimonadota bacterium]